MPSVEVHPRADAAAPGERRIFARWLRLASDAPDRPVRTRAKPAAWLALLAASLLLAANLLSPLLKRAPGEILPSVPSVGDPAGLARHFSAVGTLTLRENDEVVTVAPRVTLDPSGGFLVADSRESQVRRYGPGGELLGYFGRKGRGPREFTHLSAALPAPDGGILTFDMGGRAAHFDAEGREVEWTRELGVAPIHEAVQVNDTLVLLSGRKTGPDGIARLLHYWNPRTGRLLRSAFPAPPHPPELAPAYAFASSTDVAVRDGLAATVFALSDTLYLFDMQGAEVERIPLPFEAFRPVTVMPPSGSDVAKFTAWRQSFTTVSQVFWAPDGGFLVEYFALEGMEPEWRLLHVTRDGRKLAEVPSTRLMAVDHQTGRLYFGDPASATLERWAVYRLRP